MPNNIICPRYPVRSVRISTLCSSPTKSDRPAWFRQSQRASQRRWHDDVPQRAHTHHETPSAQPQPVQPVQPGRPQSSVCSQQHAPARHLCVFRSRFILTLTDPAVSSQWVVHGRGSVHGFTRDTSIVTIARACLMSDVPCADPDSSLLSSVLRFIRRTASRTPNRSETGIGWGFFALHRPPARQPGHTSHEDDISSHHHHRASSHVW